MQVIRDEGSGPVVVLLHGQPGLGLDMDRVVTALREFGVRAITVDRPGYGSSPAPATGFVGNAVALKVLLDRLALKEPVTLLGFSWAGGVALEFAVAFPERIRGLVLASSVGAPESLVSGDRLLATRLVGRPVARVLPWLGRIIGASGGSRLTPADRALARRSALRWGRREWASFRVEQRALIDELPGLWQTLVPSAMPVSVVQGSRDTFVPRAAGQALAARLEARYLEVDSGHLLHLEVPMLLAAELARAARSRETRTRHEAAQDKTRQDETMSA